MLKTAIRALAEKTWSHPVTGRDAQYTAITIERWYYMARRQRDDPVNALRRAVRKDCGKVSLTTAVAERLLRQYHDYPHWSYQLHYDNLAASVKANPAMGPLHSYSTVKRYMQAHGLVRKPTPRPKGRPGEARAEEGARRARSAATKPSMSGRCGISTSTTVLSRCSLRAASGCGRSRWAFSTTIRDCAATSSGISRRRPKTSCMASPRRSRNVACPVRS